MNRSLGTDRCRNQRNTLAGDGYRQEQSPGGDDLRAEFSGIWEIGQATTVEVTLERFSGRAAPSSGPVFGYILEACTNGPSDQPPRSSRSAFCGRPVLR